MTELDARRSLAPSAGRIAMPSASDLVRRAAGLVLLTACVLKAVGAVLYPQPDRLQTVLMVQAEWVLGVWLLSGWRPRLASFVAAGAFAAFAAVSLYNAMAGQSDCGCFGPVPVSPWITLGLDVALLVLLLVFLPRTRRSAVQSSRLLLSWIGVALIGGLLGSVAIATAAPSRMEEDGRVVGDARSVALDPRAWVGKSWPLLEHTDQGGDLRQGRWTVLLYRHDCPSCQEELSQAVALRTSEPDARERQTRMAAIELAPYAARDPAPRLAGAGIKHGRLSDRYDWIVQTPVTVELEGGKVLSVRAGAEKKAEDPAKVATTKTHRDIGDIPRAAGPVHNFGYLEPGAVRRVSFPLRNESGEDWAVEEVKAECSCTAVLSKPAAVAADTEEWVSVEFAAPHEVSRYSKRLFVLGKEQGVLATLEVRAAIGLPLTVEPRDLLIETNETKDVKVVVTNHSKDPVRLLYCTSDTPGLTLVVPTEAVAPGKSAELSPRRSLGALAKDHGNFQIHTALKQQKTLEVKWRVEK